MTSDEVEKRLSLPVNPEVLSEIYDFGTNMQKEAVERIKSIESKATALAAYGTAIISILVSSSSGWLNKADIFSIWVAVVAAFCALASTAVSVQALTLRKLLTISDDEWLSKESFEDVQLLKKVWIRSLWYVLTRYGAVQERKAAKVRRAQVWLTASVAYLSFFLLHIAVVFSYSLRLGHEKVSPELALRYLGWQIGAAVLGGCWTLWNLWRTRLV